MTDDPVLIREMAPGDLAYVYSTWLRDLRDADPSGLEDEFWFPAHRAHIDRALSDRAVTALVACASDQPTEILGYVVARPEEELLWIHVRKLLRRQGLARRLLTEARVPPQVPARWATKLARTHLRNPVRSRDLRRRRPASTEARSAS